MKSWIEIKYFSAFGGQFDIRVNLTSFVVNGTNVEIVGENDT